MRHTTDGEIRSAFHKKKLNQYHKCENTLVIDELGLSHGKNRIDIAVLNGFVHGYEIKSSKDSLARLPLQFCEYRKSLEKVSIIAAPNHINALIKSIPLWCGLILAEKGPRNGITFTTLRTSKPNPDIEAFSFAHLLWRNEAIQLLSDLGVENKFLKGTRENLYQQISKIISTRKLSKKIQDCLMSRENWRAEQQLSLDDDSHPPVSKYQDYPYPQHPLKSH